MSYLTSPKELTILINTAVSEALRTNGFNSNTEMQVQVKVSAWTAAALYVEFSNDGTNFFKVVDGDNDLYGVVQADMVVDRWHTFTVPAVYKFMRFASSNDAGSAAVNQLAARTLQVLVRGLN